MTASVTLLAYAKLNLWLRLTGVKRPDGRHELESHFAPLALSDTLILQPADQFSLCVSGPFSDGVPTDETNLVWRAFDGFCRTFGPQPNLKISIEKNIPHGAGLGGGSSDAGALLAHLANQAGIPIGKVRDWSVDLGADIPAAIGPHSGHVSGIGETLGDPLPLPNKGILLVKPKTGCPTGAVFSKWSSQSAAPPESRNDLEAAACQVCPEIGDVLTYLRSFVDPNAQMTGSGSACFAMIDKSAPDMSDHVQALSAHWTHMTGFLK